MSLGKISVLGGQINYRSLTNKLPAVEYAKAKVHMWLYMLNEGKKPKKWLKANSKGTKVNFEIVNSQEEYNEGLNSLQEFINQVNEEFGLDYKLKHQ